MATDHDLIVIGANYTGAYQNLERIARGFAENAQVVEDVRDALGHAGLAAEFTTFSDSWRIRRDAMQKTFESLAKDIKKQYETWDKLDHDLGGDGSPSPDKPQRPLIDGRSKLNQDQSTDGDSSPNQRPGTPTLPQPNGTATSGGATGSDGGEATAPVPEATLSNESSAGAVDIGVATPVVGTLTGAAVVGAIYTIWKGIQDGKKSGGGSAASPGTSDDLSVRDRIERELASLKGVEESGYDVELIADAKDPDDILAILRGEGGETIEMKLDDGDLSGSGTAEDNLDPNEIAHFPEDGMADPVLNDVAELAPPVDAPLAPPDDSFAGAPGGGGGPSTESAAPAAAEPLAAPAESTSATAGATDKGSSSSAGGTGRSSLDIGSLPDASDHASFSTSADDPTSIVRSDAPASAAGVGMMGMGAMGAQQMMSSSAAGQAGSRPRVDNLKPAEPAAREAADEEEKK